MMIDWNNQLLRTLLFAPGNQPRKLAKVGSFGADAVVLDLEDAVPAREKRAARTMVSEALAGARGGVICVRINAIQGGLWRDDIAAVVVPARHALLVPKVDSPAARCRGDRRAGATAGPHAHSRPGGSCRRSRNRPDGRGDPMLYARSRVVVATRAAGLPAPIYGPFMALNDDEGLHRDTLLLPDLGYGGRVTIYPPHVPVIHATFASATPEEIAAAEPVVTSYEAARAAGSAAIQVDGRCVDEPVYQRARQRLLLHAALASTSGIGEPGQ